MWYLHKNDQFVKTGSGQAAIEKHAEQEGVFFLRAGAAPADA
jgi:hypothetical protein